MPNRKSLIRLNRAVAAQSVKWVKTACDASIDEAGNYYEYVHRWRVLLLLGLIIGGLTGFAISVQPAKQVFQAEGTLVFFNDININFIAVLSSKMAKDPESAVSDLVTIRDELSRRVNSKIEIRQIIVKRHFPEPLWKSTALGSVIGWLFVIGVVYIWEDVLHISNKGQRPPKRG